MTLPEKNRRNENEMTVKITMSYETEIELEKAKRILQGKGISCKIPKNQKGRYKKAYFFIKDNRKKDKD